MYIFHDLKCHAGVMFAYLINQYEKYKFRLSTVFWGNKPNSVIKYKIKILPHIQH